MRKTPQLIEKETDAFLKKLKEVYCSSVIVSVLPLWTVWNDEDKEFKSVEKSCLKSTYEKYSEYIIDGYALVPHDESYFYDGLHPNDKGFELYGNNLAKELRCIFIKQ